MIPAAPAPGTEALDIVLASGTPEPADMTQDRVWGVYVVRWSGRDWRRQAMLGRQLTVQQALATTERECQQRGIGRA